MEPLFWYFSKKCIGFNAQSLMQFSLKVVTIAKKHQNWKLINLPPCRAHCYSKDLGGWRLWFRFQTHEQCSTWEQENAFRCLILSLLSESRTDVEFQSFSPANTLTLMQSIWNVSVAALASQRSYSRLYSLLKWVGDTRDASPVIYTASCKSEQRIFIHF